VALKLHNTLTRKRETFESLEPGKVGMYTCGPTVYWFAHIGNYRTYLFEDVLRRTLEYLGYKVEHVMNITDVGHLTSDADAGADKMEEGARREGKTVWDIAQFYTDAFFKDMDELNIERPSVVCKATEHVGDMIALTRRLVERGFAYETDEAIYFHVPLFKDYTQLDRQRLEDKAVAVRAEVQEDSQKRYPADFALWFKAIGRFANHIMVWDSPWGKGFPGWHIECSAMSMKYLGETFDIHCGGIDAIPVHHTNEIAQAEAATGKKFVRYWLHGQFLRVDGGKMSKSLGNLYLVDDMKAKGLNPLAFRIMCFSAHYRAHLNFTWEGMASAQSALDSLYDFVREAKRAGDGPEPEWVAEYRSRFKEAIEDDLNMPRAMSAVWDLRGEAYRRQEMNVLPTLYDFDKVLGLKLESIPEEGDLEPELMTLIRDREDARTARDWKRADEIREELASRGISLEDRADGTVWRKLPSEGRE